MRVCARAALYKVLGALGSPLQWHARARTVGAGYFWPAASPDFREGRSRRDGAAFSSPDHDIAVRLASVKTRDGTAIGQKTWTGALLLARALVTEVAAARGSDACANFCVEGKTCLEFGCGTGLAGLTAIALDCEDCTFTDCSLPTLCDLRASVALLPAARQPRALIRRHVWESDCPDNIGQKVRHWSNADTCQDPAFRPASLSDHDVYDW